MNWARLCPFSPLLFAPPTHGFCKIHDNIFSYINFIETKRIEAGKGSGSEDEEQKHQKEKLHHLHAGCIAH